VNKAANRSLNTGFFIDEPGSEDHIYSAEEKPAPYDFAAVVHDYDAETGLATIQQRSHFKVGQEIEFFGPKGRFFKQMVEQLYDMNGNKLDVARHPLEMLKIKTNEPVEVMDIMRKRIR